MKPYRITDEQLNKMIRQRFSHSLMSNTKWKKLIQLLVKHHQLIKYCRVKLIWEAEVYRHLIITSLQRYNFDFNDVAMEAMITGNPKGWYAYKEIQWLEFPKRLNNLQSGLLPETEEFQNIKLITEKIRSIGHFHIEIDDEIMRLYAYQ